MPEFSGLRRGALPSFAIDGAADRLAARPRIAQTEIPHLALQRVAMDPQLLAGSALVPGAQLQRPVDHASLQNLNGFREENIALEHLLDQPVKFFFHSV